MAKINIDDSEVFRSKGRAGICPTCNGQRWICEEHGLPLNHIDFKLRFFKFLESTKCTAAGDPCPNCNRGSPPAMPPGFVGE